MKRVIRLIMFQSGKKFKSVTLESIEVRRTINENLILKFLYSIKMRVAHTCRVTLHMLICVSICAQPKEPLKLKSHSSD